MQFDGRGIFYSTEIYCSLHGGFGAYESEAALDSAHVLVGLFGEREGEDLLVVSFPDPKDLTRVRTVCGKMRAKCAK